MPKLKFLIGSLLGLTVIIAQVGTVYAAPPLQDGASITGTVQDAVVEADPKSGSQTVVITLLVNGETQMMRVSVETAIGLRLIALDEVGNPVLDENGIPVVDDSMLGTDVKINPTTIIPDEPVMEEKQHPVGSKIAEFFSSFMDVDYELVMTSHANGFGFGTITQALWMTEKLGGDATLFQTILDAKKTNNYENVSLPDGTIPQNWGQLKKVVLQGEDDNNPGDVVSSEKGTPDNSGNGSGNGNENGNGTPPVQSKDRDDDHNWKKDKPETPPGQAKDKDNNRDSNQPETPPGQSKDKKNNGNSGNLPGQNKDKGNNGNRKIK